MHWGSTSKYCKNYRGCNSSDFWKLKTKPLDQPVEGSRPGKRPENREGGPIVAVDDSQSRRTVIPLARGEDEELTKSPSLTLHICQHPYIAPSCGAYIGESLARPTGYRRSHFACSGGQSGYFERRAHLLNRAV